MTVEEEQAAVSSVRAAVSDVLQDDQALRAWCTRKTIARFLQARKWDISRALKQLRKTLEWRKTYRPEQITWDEVDQATCGKQFISPAKDRNSQPIIVFRPRLLVYTMEAASRMADRAGSGKVTWLVDFAGCNIHKDLPLKVRQQAIHLLQEHYPERLGLLIGYQPPRRLALLLKVMTPFLDPGTKSKICFVSGKQSATFLAEHFDLDQLETSFSGGRSQWQYQPEIYAAKMKQEEFLMRSLTEAFHEGDRLSALAA